MQTRNHDTVENPSDLKTLVREGQQVLKSGAHLLTDQAHAKLERALEAADALKERARDGVKATDEVIRDYPYPSLGIAFGVGVLIGFLLQRK